MTRPTSAELRRVLAGVACRSSASALRRAERDSAGDPARAAATLVWRARHRDVIAAVLELDHDPRPVARWIVDTAAAVLRSSAAGIADERRSTGTAAPAGELTIDDELADRLAPWLLELARDVARVRGGLVMVEAELGRAAAGIARVALEPPVVELASGLTGHELARVVAHELGHVVDRACTARTVHERETFADRLAEMALEHRPRTVAALLELGQRIDVPAPSAEARDDELADRVVWALAASDLELAAARRGWP